MLGEHRQAVPVHLPDFFTSRKFISSFVRYCPQILAHDPQFGTCVALSWYLFYRKQSQLKLVCLKVDSFIQKSY